MVDVFDEVEEQLRSDRYKTLARKTAPWVVGGLAIALAGSLGYWAWDSHRGRVAAESSEKYAAAVESFGANNTAAATTGFEELTKSGAPAYKALSMMQLAGLKLEEGKTAEAVALFDQAADAAPNEALADVARLKSAFALLDTAPYADIEKRLTPLTEEKRPYRVQAKEALAFAKLSAGKMTEARADFSVLTLLAESSDQVRERARTAMQMIDSGSAKSLPAIAKAAASATPAPPTQPDGIPAMVPEGAQ
ncbi:tetratricopeptide repeat protein [Caulobacter sp. NIBR2454]|uniref:tetratricopeptide repeat protein n=1 Tax=Caulobacter sp. NIBR2454 TaxID=3015996 RepID=UPI0022B6C76F|nr:tetratricopeptide repeat protein [Caulobacter sp. NIBR2454]